MDMIERKRLWFEDEKRAQAESFIRHLEWKARCRRFLAFCFNWRQVVDDPVAAVPASGDHNAAPTQGCAPTPGAGTRAAGFRDAAPTNALTPLASGSRLPGGPHPYIRSRASRISAALNRHT